MASISSIVTRGFGSWGSVNDLSTRGFGIGAAAAITYDGAGIEAKLGNYRLQATTSGSRLHIKSGDYRLHATTEEH
jgi:hypothetical protein